ncbi:hypothetical protein HELRODRAFT_175840 [Helobdella robusta]|uniref:Endonuclease/exonuclease/phosphatase domain-containing protein n=1 Tax=Helobdella robusta TaxID=6412 RepID=T1F9R2_HELRO|nr:hypothetical protein HELRODRAFT_175840 [Helobdella robusta]ESO00419.1 hypothetical protein HELRODRAFT_175840 [Helobdella robusta]
MNQQIKYHEDCCKTNKQNKIRIRFPLMRAWVMLTPEDMVISNNIKTSKNTRNKNDLKQKKTIINKQTIKKSDFKHVILDENSNKIRILQWNIKGMKSNLPELQTFLSKYNPHIICLQETKPTEKKQMKLKNFMAFHKPVISTKLNSSAGLSICNHDKIIQSPVHTNIRDLLPECQCRLEIFAGVRFFLSDSEKYPERVYVEWRIPARKDSAEVKARVDIRMRTRFGTAWCGIRMPPGQNLQ